MAQADGRPSFDRDIKPLFRDKDRARMEWAFDLWERADVKENAPQILQRLEDGDMPCDESWSRDKIDLFRAWMDGGMDP
jgi:hypothetical protein